MATNQGKNQIVTRFPPSPTGLLQMGNLRTAIYNYLFARQHKGLFLFRIEDTDKERSTKEFETTLIQNLKWLGLDFDNQDFSRQSERGAVYEMYLKKLVSEGKAYISKEDTLGDESKRSEVIRFKNPNKEIIFSDLIRGEIKFDTTDLGDFVIAKSMTEPIYHLAVVVDDFESNITHIIRGEDHISNTPRQILIQDAIGAPRPIYAHLPLILDKDRAKLSKRKHGEKVSLQYFINEGYLPSAIINYMTMLGWNPGTPEEIFTLDELIKKFDIKKVQKGGAIFDEAKLRWVNKEHLKRMSDVQSLILNKMEKLYPDKDRKVLERLMPIILERIETLGDIEKMKNEGELTYFFEKIELDASKLPWKGENKKTTGENLEKTLEILKIISSEDFTKEKIKESLSTFSLEKGRGAVLWPMRYALSGKDKSPDPFTLAEALGQEETILRLKNAIGKLNE